MSLEWRQQRIAKNETSFRDINERLESGLRQARHNPERLEFICECGDRECESSVPLSFEEYEVVREDSRRFLIVPGHVFPETEHVVASNERYEVVEKFGEAVDVADASDRRSADGRRSDSATP
ncbi:hypothetical protein OJ998_10325 [Solirubrobacter taibaiensis]|nr:hypothetical protein [Solirubrobacter taibaiensis]